MHTSQKIILKFSIFLQNNIYLCFNIILCTFQRIIFRLSIFIADICENKASVKMLIPTCEKDLKSTIIN